MCGQLSLSRFLDFSEAPVIDLRSDADFSKCHLVNSANIPLNDIIERMYELPKRDKPLRLCGSFELVDCATQILNEKGYQIVATLDWDNLPQSQLGSGFFESGSRSVQLWSPAPIVQYFNEEIWKKSNFRRQHFAIEDKCQNLPVNPTALDLACGSGRDAVYLAQNGWKVTAIDYLAGALAKTHNLARRNEVAIETMQLDLELDPLDLTTLNRTFDMVQ
ncbi:MAG: methyltransferase domain-containing protein, partial [Kangiellaceae bacterium]|nr:methyltransferase domain-containing protein [Kangiellaceae bacterium]